MKIVSTSRFLYVQHNLEIIITIATQLQRYFDVDHFDNIYGNGFDDTNLSEYDHTKVRTWNDVINYSILFLNGKIPKTVFHSGVYASETLYILDFLKEIHQYGFLTLDSQPGCVIDGLTHEPTKNINASCMIQLPYINLVGPIEQLQKLIDHITDTFIVIYRVDVDPIKDITSTLLQKLCRLRLDQRYGSIYLSVDDQKKQSFFRWEHLSCSYQISVDFINYILTNRFFEEIINYLRQLFNVGTNPTLI